MALHDFKSNGFGLYKDARSFRERVARSSSVAVLLVWSAVGLTPLWIVGGESELETTPMGSRHDGADWNCAVGGQRVIRSKAVSSHAHSINVPRMRVVNGLTTEPVTGNILPC